MPRINNLIDELGKALLITTLDLTHGYWQVPAAKKDRHKPFWVISIQANAVWPTGSTGDIPADYGSSYTGQYESVSAYLDDLVIFSNSWEEHLRHLREVLHRLEEAGLTARLKKCQFAMKTCNYLGHVVGNGVIRPAQDKIAAIESFATPKTTTDVRDQL